MKYIEHVRPITARTAWKLDLDIDQAILDWSAPDMNGALISHKRSRLEFIDGSEMQIVEFICPNCKYKQAEIIFLDYTGQLTECTACNQDLEF